MPFLPPTRFSVSQVRVAAACPRILYFDSDDNRRQQRKSPTVTRIREPGNASFAAGSLFHQSVERFNRFASQSTEVQALLQSAGNQRELFQGLMQYFSQKVLNRPKLAQMTADVIANFSRCVELYFGELADILHYSRTRQHSPANIIQELFTSLPKRVDVTLHVGPHRQPVRVRGSLDYVFFDRRADRLRILDYKLTPAVHPDKDLFQVAAYALLYHHQHGYQCHAGVLYLHPERHLIEMPWEQIYSLRHKVYDLLASMADWSRYDPEAGTGLHPRGDLNFCSACRWQRICEDRLGEKSVGSSHHGWSASEAEVEPEVEVGSVNSDGHEEADAEEFSDEAPLDAHVANGELEAAANETVNEPTPANEGSATATDGRMQLGAAVQFSAAVELEKRHLSTHTAIVGAAGSGKTWMAKVFVEEAILNGVPVLAIDPQGDLVQFLHQQPRERISPADLSRYDQFCRLVEPRIFTPGTSHGIRLTLSPIRLPSLNDLTRLPAEQREDEFQAIINSVAMHLVALTLKGKRNVDQPQTFIARALRGLMQAGKTDSLQLTDIAAAVHAPESLGMDDADLLIKKSERENLGRQLYALAHGPLARLFTGGWTIDLNRLKTPTVAGKVPLNVIYLNALTEPEKHAFLAALGTEVYRWMACVGGDPFKPQLLFYIDEARDFLPAGAAEPPAKRPISRLFTQGRKFGVGCLFCTQSPRSVDYNVFGNCSTKIIGRLETPQDSERVAEWFSTAGPRPEWIAARAGAAPGSFVGRWPEQEAEFEGATFRSRQLFSLHEGAWSPERLEAEMANNAFHRQLRAELT